MSSCDHDHKVCDSHLRSFLVTVTANGIEVVIDYFLFNFFLGQPAESLALSIATQVVCYLTTFSSLRIWNRIKWGWKVIDVPVSGN